MLIQFLLRIECSKSKLFSCLQKVDRVTNYCKRPIHHFDIGHNAFCLPGKKEVSLWGDTPYNGLQGGIFFKPQAYETVGISIVKVYKRSGESVIWVCERAQKG